MPTEGPRFSNPQPSYCDGDDLICGRSQLPAHCSLNNHYLYNPILFSSIRHQSSVTLISKYNHHYHFCLCQESQLNIFLWFTFATVSAPQAPSHFIQIIIAITLTQTLEKSFVCKLERRRGKILMQRVAHSWSDDTGPRYWSTPQPVQLLVSFLAHPHSNTPVIHYTPLL